MDQVDIHNATMDTNTTYISASAVNIIKVSGGTCWSVKFSSSQSP